MSSLHCVTLGGLGWAAPTCLNNLVVTRHVSQQLRGNKTLRGTASIYSVRRKRTAPQI